MKALMMMLLSVLSLLMFLQQDVNCQNAPKYLLNFYFLSAM